GRPPSTTVRAKSARSESSELVRDCCRLDHTPVHRHHHVLDLPRPKLGAHSLSAHVHCGRSDHVRRGIRASKSTCRSPGCHTAACAPVTRAARRACPSVHLCFKLVVSR